MERGVVNLTGNPPAGIPTIVVLLLCAAALLIDGFDVYLVGNLGPAIATHFHTRPANLALVFLLQQTGLAVGAFLVGPIAGRIGRRNVLLGCAAAFGVLTLAAIFSDSLLEFAVLRAIAGLFLSGLVPTAIAMLVDVTPAKRQGLFVALAFTGYGAGTIGGALVAAVLLRHYGWQSGFWIGGIVPLLFVLVAGWLLPQGIGRLRRSPVGVAPQSTITAIRGLFAAGRARPTLFLWATFFLASGTLALMASWMPTFFAERGGIPLPVYSAVAAYSLAGALVGTATIGLLLDRRRPTPVAMKLYLLLAAALELVGRARFGTPIFIVGFIALTLFQGAGQTSLSVVVAQSYPRDLRVSGIGWAFGAGRIGAIVGPGLGGLMMAADFSLAQFFLCIGVPFLLCAGLLAGLDRTTLATREPA